MIAKNFRLFAALLLICAISLSYRVQAATYPDRPVRIICGFPVGGLIDIVARVVGEKLSMILGQPFIVEAHPGATGMIATELAARAKPDGYRLLMINDNFALNPSVFKTVPYTQDQFAPIGFIGLVPMVFTASNEMHVHTVQDVIDVARAKPGVITYASIGAGSQSHLGGEMLSKIAGIKMQHVPYPGGALAINDLIAGRIDTMFLTPVIGVPMMRAGKLTPLGTAGDERLHTLPDVPTMKEAGYPVDVASWMGLVAPARTPQAVRDKLQDAMIQALTDPDVQQRLADLSVIIRPLRAEAFDQFIRSETVRWHTVTEKAGVQPQ